MIRMRRGVSVGAMLLAIALLVPSGVRGENGASPAVDPAPFFFVQMADPQFGFFATPVPLAHLGVEWNGDDVVREAALFERAIAHVNRLRPAFLVICGDLVNLPRHVTQTAEFNRIRARLRDDVPLYLVAGNHDVGNTPTRESLAWFRSTFGPDRYTFDQAGMRGIVLNSVLLREPARVPYALAAQRQWLENALDRARRDGVQQILVFQHHPLFLEDPTEGASIFNLPPDARQQYLELFKAYGVRAVLAGHYHRNALARDGALEMITTSAVGRPLGDDPSGFRIVKVWPDRIEHAYYGLDEVPDAVTLGD